VSFYIPYDNIDIERNTGRMFKFRSKSAETQFLMRLECYGRSDDKLPDYVPLSLYMVPVYHHTYFHTRTGMGFDIVLYDSGEYPVTTSNIRRFIKRNGWNGKLSYYLGYYEYKRYTLVASLEIDDITRDKIASVPSYPLRELKKYYFEFGKSSQLYIDKQLSDMRGVSVFPL
jgi:signal peptidase I